MLILDGIEEGEIRMEKEEWLKRYKARMVERGLHEREATAVTEATGNEPDFLDDDPEGAADDELSFWANDD